MTHQTDCILRSVIAAYFLVVLVWLVNGISLDAHAAQVTDPELPVLEACGSADDCFSAAAWPKERLGNLLTRDQVAALRLERLRQVMEQFPASLWAKRASLLTGILLLERNPAAAMPYLRAAQRDFPVLDDYVRFWMGEALLHLGDAKEAAILFESVPETVPESNLLNLVTLRAGEAWYQASSCPESVAWLTKAVRLNEKEPQVAQAWLRLAACYLRDHQVPEGREALTRLWMKFPHSKEAQEAEALLLTNLGGEPWSPRSEDHYIRAQAYLGQALHAEAIEELRKFLARDLFSIHRGDATLKMGIAQVRLKLYDQAREIFQKLVAEQVPQSADAMVWLARVYLRQDLGVKLLTLSRSAPMRALSRERQAQIHLFAGIWLEDQRRYNEAIQTYRLVGKLGEPGQRAEAQWREGWVYYRTARYREAIHVWKPLLIQEDNDFAPQALYWTARSHGRLGSPLAGDVFAKLCARYPYTYYCQLAREQLGISVPFPVGPVSDLLTASSSGSPRTPGPFPHSDRNEIQQHPAYRRAAELKALGLEQDAARELTVLVSQFSQKPESLMSLFMLLHEAGAYHHALRLTRARFRDKLERTGGHIEPGLWTVAYPTGLIPTIETQATNGVDPYLVAAIIREESQYDWRAISRVGAIGLMQVMPATAQAVAQRHHLPTVGREDLFDQETNIRIGVRYVEQLLGQFSGNLVSTIAAYNAGPVVTTKWLATHGGLSPDEFVELIPFNETRQYVKRVLRSYKEYKRLAQEKPVP